jgi:hypothetical protein
VTNLIEARPDQFHSALLVKLTKLPQRKPAVDKLDVRTVNDGPEIAAPAQPVLARKTPVLSPQKVSAIRVVSAHFFKIWISPGETGVGGDTVVVFAVSGLCMSHGKSERMFRRCVWPWYGSPFRVEFRLPLERAYSFRHAK